MELPSSEQMLFFEKAAAQYQTDLASDTAVQAYLTALGFREDRGFPVDTRASWDPEGREDLAVRPTFKADLMALGVREDLGVPVATRASLNPKVWGDLAAFLEQVSG